MYLLLNKASQTKLWQIPKLLIDSLASGSPFQFPPCLTLKARRDLHSSSFPSKAGTTPNVLHLQQGLQPIDCKLDSAHYPRPSCPHGDWLEMQSLPPNLPCTKQGTAETLEKVALLFPVQRTANWVRCSSPKPSSTQPLPGAWPHIWLLCQKGCHLLIVKVLRYCDDDISNGSSFFLNQTEVWEGDFQSTPACKFLWGLTFTGRLLSHTASLRLTQN